MIIVDNLSYSYKEGEEIICDMSYRFKKGNLYLITGENGAGKTTLIKLILGLLKPNSGAIHIDEKNRVAYLPDYNGIYDDLSVIDNVIFRLSLYNIKFKQKKSLFYELLDQYSLSGKENQLVKNLSLGMKKKVGFICTILSGANIYIFDEPTGGLDEESTLDVMNMLNRLCSREVLIICISHEDILKKGLDGIKVTIQNGSVK